MEIVSSTAESTATDIFIRVFAEALGGQIGYLLNYSDNIQALRKQVLKLKDTRGTVQKEIDDPKRKREFILPDVKIWISAVDNVSADAEKFLDDEAQANNRCVKGCCINLKSRYRFSKAAKQKIEAISELQEDGNFPTLSQPDPPSSSIIYPAVGYSGIFESRESIKNEIAKALKDDKVSIIGICGMAGVGKTTLVKEIGKRAEEENLFDSVVMVVVSQTPSIVNIQREIASMLGLTSLSDYPGSARASLPWERIKKEKRILIILDDVWARIQLEEIGIPFGKDNGGCKIVLTSRSIDVCDQMHCDKTSTVGTLSTEESWALFKELVGMDVENSILSPIAGEIVAKCHGLPIAIVTIARALQNKKKHVWTDVARQLKTSTPTDIPGLQGSVISSLELSIKYLESEDVKSLFFGSLFPEDFKIPITVLVRYGAAMRWFENVETMEDVRHRAYAIVSTLISSFLLIHEKNDDDGEEYVKMHNVVRDVAHVIAPKYNQIFLVKAGIGLKKWPISDTLENLTCISLISNNIEVVSSRIKCLQLQSLLLQKNPKLVLPGDFFQGMKDLIVLDLSETQLLPLPESLRSLANLRILYLNDCKLGDLSIIKHLTNLEILSLRGSNIKEIPSSFNQLIHLRLLDLNNCEELMQIAHGVISALCKLEELYILQSFDLWNFEGDEENRRRNAELVELQNLSRLTSLQIFIPNQVLLPDDNMLFKELSSFTIIVGAPEISDTEWFLRITRKYSRKLMISDNKVMVSQLLDCLKNLIIGKTEYLCIRGLQDVFLDLVDRGLNELKGLRIDDQEVTYLLNTLEMESNLTFQNLEELQIWDHPNLVEICHGEPPIQSFEKLKSLTVGQCNRLSNIVPSHFLQSFQNLEYLNVDRCESVVYIFDCENLKVTNGETKSLKDLDLKNLPKMTHVWKGDTQYIELYNLKRIKIEIAFCNILEEIFIFGTNEGEEYEEKGPRRKDHTASSPSLGNLTSISIRNCFKLKNLFTSSMVKSLVKLRSLEIDGCSTLQEIITNEELASAVQRIVFPSLSSLCLTNLDNINWFSSSSYSIEFPALVYLRIYGCPNMQIFGYEKQLAPKLNAVLTGYDNEKRWMGDLNSTMEQLFIEEKERRRQEEARRQQEGEMARVNEEV